MTHVAPILPETLKIFETVPDLYLILSADLFILTASDTYLNATYKERNNIQGKHVFEVFPDNPVLPVSDSTTNLRRSLVWVIAHKKPQRMGIQRYDVTATNHEKVFVEKYWLANNTPVLDNEGNIQYIIHRVEDVTEQVKNLKYNDQDGTQFSNEELKSSKTLLVSRADSDRQRDEVYNILMDAPAMVCIFEGPQHVFKLVNPLYQKLVGNRPIVGKPISEAMPELIGQPIFSLLDQVYNTGESFYANEMIVQLDHDNSGGLGENYYNFVYQAMHDPEGEISGVMVFAYEVTPQVEARKQVEHRESELQKLNKQLEKANSNVKAANSQLLEAQLELQDLNKQLEEKVKERTLKLQLSHMDAEMQKARLERLFMQAPAAICILGGPELRFELVNPDYQEIFTGRQLLGKPLLEALPELEDNKVYKTFQNVYNTGNTHEEKEFLIPIARPADGILEDRYFRYIQQARYNDQGEVDGIVVFALEVTEQVKSRKTIEATAKRLRLITDSLPVLIGYLDKEEKYRFANKAYKAWFNQDPENLLGKPVKEIVGEKAYSGVKQYIDRALAGERLDFESEMPYRDNFTKHIRTSYVPDFQEGEVAGFYTLVHDVTEHIENVKKIQEREKEAKALAEDLTTANEQLMHTNADLDNFIYAASHDLKAPISNIEGLMLILLDTLPAEVLEKYELTEVTSMIGNSISRFKRTIEHLTEVTKLQKENNQDKVIINLSDVINEVKLDLTPQLEASEAELEVNVDCKTHLSFSEKNLRSIVYNLLSNAIKYNSPERKPEIKINCYVNEEYTVLSVQDNGLGMDLNGSQKLFTMFGRMHDHVEGSGVGLYMVKKIVENAKGRIQVESEIGRGSTFTVYLRN